MLEPIINFLGGLKNALDALVTQSEWNGGLTQEDWFTAPMFSIQSYFGPFFYNQISYINSIRFRQTQQYQRKNYNLAWVGVAREDIRQFMDVFVARVNNYMVVAALILNLAAASLFWVNNFDHRCPAFVVNYFWVSIVTSIVFLSVAIMFGIKGQNSSFINTMRLLAWELRPETPAAYNHDYLAEIDRWENAGKMKSLYRFPRMTIVNGVTDGSAQAAAIGSKASLSPMKVGRATSISPKKGGYSSGTTPKKAGYSPAPKVSAEKESSRDTTQMVPYLEHLDPATKELLYLARFAHFIRLFVPYEVYAKYSIGIALVSLAHGAAYFCLGAISWEQSAVFREVLVVLMMAIFVFLTVVIYADNYCLKSGFLQLLVVSLFMWGPLLATVAILAAPAPVVMSTFICLSALAECVLFGSMFLWSILIKHDTGKMTDSYIRGPHGQRFKGSLEVAEASAHQGEEKAATKDFRRHSVPAAEAPTPEEEAQEEAAAEAVLLSVTSLVRSALGMISAVWFVVFLIVVLDAAQVIGPTALQELKVQELAVHWPSEAFFPKAIACTNTDVFVANSYQVFRVDIINGAVQQQSCSQDSIINDVATVCDSAGNNCHVMTLSGAGNSSYASEIIDCGTYAALPLLQETIEASGVSLSATGNLLTDPGSGTLLAMHTGSIVQYGWDQSQGGWAPQWAQAHVSVPDRDGSPPTTAPEVWTIDTTPDQLFLFGRQAALPGGVAMTGVSFMEIRKLDSGLMMGRYRLPTKYPDLVAGCAVSENAAVIVTQAPGQDAKLLRVTVP